MYIQRFVKGIAGNSAGGPTWEDTVALVTDGVGIPSNWWRTINCWTPSEVQNILTKRNLLRHLNEYDKYGSRSPFISLAAGCVERNKYLENNFPHSGVDTALSFATRDFDHDGYLFYGWVLVGLNPAVEIAAVAESVRELNVYRDFFPHQLEGEITAKIHIPANQIEWVEHWDPSVSKELPARTHRNVRFVSPIPILNFREMF